MACLEATAISGSVALVAATTKTVLQIAAPANQRLKLLSWQISFDGATSTAVPATVRLLRQTTAGTGTSVTPGKVLPGLDETIQTTAAKNFSAEPTAGDVLDTRFIPVYGGQFEEMFPFSQEYQVGGGGRIAIDVTAPAGVNCAATLKFEE